MDRDAEQKVINELVIKLAFAVLANVQQDYKKANKIRDILKVLGRWDKAKETLSDVVDSETDKANRARKGK